MRLDSGTHEYDLARPRSSVIGRAGVDAFFLLMNDETNGVFQGGLSILCHGRSDPAVPLQSKLRVITANFLRHGNARKLCANVVGVHL